jgi:hypothetical protein
MNHKITIFILSILVCYISNAQETKAYIRPRVQNIVKKLEKESIAHLGGPVGEAGKPETNNRYYKLYKRLGNVANDDELVALTRNHMNTITAYAFSLLHSRNFSELKEIFLQNLNDTTNFWVASGCTGTIFRVNSFMLWQLNPTNSISTTAYLTKEEFETYSQIIGKM